MGAPLEITRTDYTSAELRSLSGRCSDGAQVRRLLALALILDGYSRTEAAALGGMDRQTLRDWVHRYNDFGVDGLKSRPSSGRPPALTQAQMAELRELVIKGPDPANRRRSALAVCGPAGRGGAPVFGGGAREHDRPVARRAGPDAPAAQAGSSEKGSRSRGGF
jgi:hypothetical protein